ncbi:hypothetical protein [Candidatus Williamhamiltonella defendens]|uniref:hypothetical protein n=1 Tax=Candidatus Williamhamiltonella defendens TaxID=138072 RepID=UPI00165218F8|nr:hypothetical protein [Candidatus Hamiltonella defensa]
MQKIGDITNTATPDGEFTNGNVAGGVSPTLLPAKWFNTIQRELCHVITKNGGVLNPDDDPQIFEILNSVFLSQKQNGSDIPDKHQFIENLGLSETVDCAKNALDKRHGGEVQGQIQVNDTLRVSKNGKTATYQEDGNIDGECWGGLLNQWITTKITEAVQSRAPWEEVNRTFVRDIRLSSVQLMSVQTYDRQLPAGAVVTGFKTDGLWEIKSYAYYRFIQKNINGQWITVGQG